MASLTGWWTHWPGAEDVGDPTDPWLVNYRAHWGRQAGPLAVTMRTRNESTVLHVFAEYDRLRARIAEHRRLSQEERTQRSWLPHDAPDGPVLISGTPGIGKSHFIYYYAVLLMRSEQPFIVYSGPAGKRCHLITPDGVRVAPADTLDDLSASFLQSAANVPFLFDRVSVKDTPSESFFLIALFFFVQAAGPDPEHFEWAKRSTRAREFVMNPPTREEAFEVLREIFPGPRERNSDRELRRALEAYGPSIRATRDALYAGQTRALSALTAAFHSGARTPADLLTLWHPALIKSVCPSPPTPGDKGWLGPDGVLHVLANATAMRLVLARWAHLQTVRDMLDHLALVPHTPSSARWLFEAWAHLRLCEPGGGSFVLRRVDAQSDEARTVTFRQLQSAPLGEATEAGTYYISTAPYGTPCDAFLRLADGVAYAFHMTLAAAHTFDPAGLSMLPACDAPDKNYVFVVPKGRAFSFSHAGPAVDGWKFWVLKLELDRSARSVIESSYGYWDDHQRDEDQ